MSRTIDTILIKCLSRSDWVSTRQALSAAGVSSNAVDRRLACGLLRSFGSGVVGLADAPDPRRQLSRACLLAHPAGALSDIAAACLHYLPMGELLWRPQIVIPHGTSLSRSSPAVVRQSRLLPASDLTEVRGMRTTTVARTLCDLIDVVGQARAEYLVEWAIKEQRCTASELRACIEPFVRAGSRGTPQRRKLLDKVKDQPVDLSALEHDFLLLIIEHRIPGLVAQYAPPWYDGIRGIVDFAEPDKRKIIEIDGRRWHSLTQDMTSDRARARTARGEGWELVRYGYAEIRHRPLEVIADLRLVLELA